MEEFIQPEVPKFGSENEKLLWESSLSDSQRKALSINQAYESLDENQKKEKWAKIKEKIGSVLAITGIISSFGVIAVNCVSYAAQHEKVIQGLTDSLNPRDPGMTIILPLLISASALIVGLITEKKNKEKVEHLKEELSVVQSKITSMLDSNEQILA